MDGKPFLEDLKRQAENEKLDLEEGVRYLLIATVGIVEYTQEIINKQGKLESKLTGHLEQWETVNKKRNKLLINIENFNGELKKNPAFILGNFFHGKPKRLIAILATVFIALNAWISLVFLPGVRRMILLFLVPFGFPKEWVDVISPPGD